MLLAQYYRLKPPVKSILRIVSADFNENTTEGKRMAEIQRKLFLNDKVLDIVLRLNNKNEFLKSGILNTKVGKFLGQKAIISKFNRKTYMGKCGTCHEMCGVTM